MSNLGYHYPDHTIVWEALNIENDMWAIKATSNKQQVKKDLIISIDVELKECQIDHFRKLEGEIYEL
ncbi:hypothetical protein F3D3_2384 [Fusibacter sp. 3D3]|nr:hypothetical protein F3D3_2384 [Fusibacter sp. 3D3]